MTFIGASSIPSFVSIAALAAAVAGCSAESGTASPAATSDTASAVAAQSAGTPAAGPRGAGERAPHGGPALLLVAALREPIHLTSAQRATIESALAANGAGGPPPFDVARARALAADIRAGKVDVSATAGPSADEMAAHQAASARALATLHATLTSEQRQLLVAALAKHDADHAGGASDPGGGACPPGGPGGPDDAKGPMGHLLEGLDVTPTQEAKIRAKLSASRPTPPSDADRAAFHAAQQARLQTFAGDTFDAKAFAAPPVGEKNHADRFAADLAVVVSVLEPAQREKLAARIEAGPPAR